MVFGEYSVISSKKDHSFLTIIKNNLYQEGLKYYNFNFKSLLGGFFLNPIFPKEFNDYIFEKENEAFIFVSGNIYNQECLSEQYHINKNIPTPEFIFQLHLLNGEEFVCELNGDFVILLNLFSKDEFFVFRDHLGVQPISYCFLNNTLFFSSDAISLSKSLFQGDLIQKEWLLNYFIFSNPNLSPHENVKLLTPGHFLKIKGNKFQEKKYWFPENIKTCHTLKYEEVIKNLKNLLNDALKIRCSKGYVAGSHLSGGLDSSLVASLAKEKLKTENPFYGFSYSPQEYFPELTSFSRYGSSDEREIIRKIAKKNNIIPVFNDSKPSDFLKFLNESYLNQGSVWEEGVRKRARDKGVNLLFNGWGGDEFISKSTSGLTSELFFNLNWISLLRSFKGKSVKEIIIEFIYYIIFPAFGLLSSATKKSLKTQAYYIKDKFSQSDKIQLKKNYTYKTLKERILKAISMGYIAERCEKWNIQGFRQGVEYRYPLLDIRIVEFILKVPSKFFIKDNHSRVLMKDLAKGYLPEEVLKENTKIDKILFYYNYDMLKTLFHDLIKEIENWKLNPDLDFINFPLLERDLKNFQESTKIEKNYNLYRTLYFFKILHEFTQTYRQQTNEQKG